VPAGCWLAAGLHFLDEQMAVAADVGQRHQFHIHMFVTMRGAVNVQHPLRLAAAQCHLQRAGLALFIAGPVIAVDAA
jgi:hypothetical protein